MKIEGLNVERTFTLKYKEHFLSLAPDGSTYLDSCEVEKTTGNVEELMMAVRVACAGPSYKPDPITITIEQGE